MAGNNSKLEMRSLSGETTQSTSTKATDTNANLQDDDDNDNSISNESQGISAIGDLADITKYDFNVLTFNYFWMRIGFIFLAYFFAMICLLYAIGQISKLELEDFMCERKEYTDILKHSREMHLSGGSSNGGCYKSKYVGADKDKLTTQDAYTVTFDYSPDRSTKFVLMILLFIVFMVLGIIHIVQVIKDIIRMKHPMKQKKKRKGFKCNCENTDFKLIKIYYKYLKWYKYTFAVDSGKWIILSLIRETMEVILQFIVLISYNGYNVINNQITLAEMPDNVINFVCLIGFNSIFAGLLWFHYAMCSKCLPSIFHGIFFHYIIFIFDTIFDTFYGLFPLIIHGIFTKNAIAFLGTKTFINFIGVLIPLLLLLKTLRKSLSICRKIIHDEWKYSSLQSAPIAKKNSLVQASNYITPKIVVTDEPWIDIYDKISNKLLWIRKLIISMIGIAMIAVGCAVITININFFDENERMCAIFDYKNPETLFFNIGCKQKVYPYPFGPNSNSNNNCNCRSFSMYNRPSRHTNGNDVELILNTWNMLQTFFLRMELVIEAGRDLNIANQTTMNLNKDLISNMSPFIRAFGIGYMIINEIDPESFANKLSDAEFIEFQHTLLPKLWDFSSTPKLKYLRIIDALAPSLSNSICKLNNLQYFQFEFTGITEIPECMQSLNKLTTVLLCCNNLLKFPLFYNLSEYDLSHNALLTIDMNNISIYKPIINSLSSSYDHDIEYYFQNTLLCDNYNEYLIDSNSIGNNLSFYDMNEELLIILNHTQCCKLECSTTLANLLCNAKSHHDGVCNSQCNLPDCYFDGGDCNQLCLMELNVTENGCPNNIWFDGKCDSTCNNTDCGWDQSDCVWDQSDCLNIDTNISNCNCPINWLNDGWCDDCLRINKHCLCDGTDCSQCDVTCENLNFYFTFIANSIKGDNVIDQDELCSKWDIISTINSNWINCTEAMKIWDLNGNSMVGAYEGLIAIHDVADIPYNKSLQLNCTLCTDYSLNTYYL